MILISTEIAIVLGNLKLHRPTAYWRSQLSLSCHFVVNYIKKSLGNFRYKNAYHFNQILIKTIG